jgi:hypothetical protein
VDPVAAEYSAYWLQKALGLSTLYFRQTFLVFFFPVRTESKFKHLVLGMTDFHLMHYGRPLNMRKLMQISALLSNVYFWHLGVLNFLYIFLGLNLAGVALRKHFFTGCM